MSAKTSIDVLPILTCIAQALQGWGVMRFCCCKRVLSRARARVTQVKLLFACSISFLCKSQNPHSFIVTNTSCRIRDPHQNRPNRNRHPVLRCLSLEDAGDGPNMDPESTVLSTELSESFGPHRVSGKDLSEFLCLLSVCQSEFAQCPAERSEFSLSKHCSRKSHQLSVRFLRHEGSPQSTHLTIGNGGRKQDRGPAATVILSTMGTQYRNSVSIAQKIPKPMGELNLHQLASSRASRCGSGPNCRLEGPPPSPPFIWRALP